MTKVIMKLDESKNYSTMEALFTETGKALVDQIERFVQIALYGENEHIKYKLEIENA